LHPIAKALCFPFAAALLTAPGASAAVEDGLDFFEKKIRPVLVENCYKCHSAEAEKNGKLEGKLRLDLREGVRGRGESGLVAVIPGKPDKSNLYRAVTYLDSELVMPPKVEVSQVASTAMFGVKAVLDGRTKEVVDLLRNNFLR